MSHTYMVGHNHRSPRVEPIHTQLLGKHFVTFWGKDERNLISRQMEGAGIGVYRRRLCIASSNNVYIINDIQKDGRSSRDFVIP